MTNLTKELFDDLKNTLQAVINIREILIEHVKHLDPKDQKFVISLQKHAINLTTELTKKHINGMKTLMNTTDPTLPEFIIFAKITKFIQQTATLMQQRAPMLYATLSSQPQNKFIINKLSTGIEELIRYTQTTQKNITHLLNAERRLKTNAHSLFKQHLGDLSGALSKLLEECHTINIKFLNKTLIAPSYIQLSKKQHTHTDTYPNHHFNKHLPQNTKLQQRHTGRHGSGH